MVPTANVSSYVFLFAETPLNNGGSGGGGGGGGLLLSPPHGSISQQRETMQITQPASAPNSPLASPGLTGPTTSFTLTSSASGSGANGASTSTSGCLTSSSSSDAASLTGDPNWQASKPTVRERNAAMFNNELMSDIRFYVGGPGNFILHTYPFYFEKKKT